jgi:hypothetical protein
LTGTGSTGGSTTSTGGSTGSTTGSTGAVLLGDGGCGGAGGPLTACVLNGDCQCPAECVLDPTLTPYIVSTPQGECELPCVDGGCNDAFDVCRNGYCSPNTCAQVQADAGTLVGPGGWGTCDAGGTLDGTCVFVPGVLLDQNTLLSGFYCVQGGTSDGGCDPNATRQSASDSRCLPGLACTDLGFGDAGCRLRCDRSVIPTTCPTGDECAGAGLGIFGTCYPTGTNGCPIGYPTVENQLCAGAIDCGCPQQCVLNANWGVELCEAPCQTAADCDLDNAHCAGGFCETNFCAGDPLGDAGPGQLDGPCPIDDGGPGTCVPFAQLFIGSGEPEFGICLRPGSATAACIEPFSTHTPIQAGDDPGLPLAAGDLCAAGSVCIAGSCTSICNPIVGDDAGIDAGCPMALACLEQDGDPVTHFGVCGACVTSNNPCVLDGDCCSGFCTNFSCQ